MTLLDINPLREEELQDFEAQFENDEPDAGSMEIRGRIVTYAQIEYFVTEVKPRLVHAEFVLMMTLDHPNIFMGTE